MSEKAKSLNADDRKNEESSEDAAGKSSLTTSTKEKNAEKAATTISEKRIHSAESFHCLLLQDTTRSSAPSHLHVLFSHFECEILTKAEILFQLVYLVALESGFAEQITCQKCISQLYISYSVVTFFDARNVLLLVQHKPVYSFDANNTKFRMKLDSIVSGTNADNGNLNFVLSGIVTGDFMIVTLTPMRENSAMDTCVARSICLTIPRYVLGSAWKDKSKPLHQFLANMNEMSYNLREKLFVPIQTEYWAMMDAELYPALLGLPSELYDSIFHCLSPNQLRILANVNKQLNQLVINSKHYNRAPTLQNRLSFLSPSQSRSSSRYRWETLF